MDVRHVGNHAVMVMASLIKVTVCTNCAMRDSGLGVHTTVDKRRERGAGQVLIGRYVSTFVDLCLKADDYQ